MRQLNMYIGTRRDVLVQVLDGKEGEIIWPEGTKFHQCARSPSGHMIWVLSHWDKMREKRQQPRALPAPPERAKL